MTKGTKVAAGIPEGAPLDSEVVQFRAQFDERSPLDELVRVGARQMLQAAIEAEVDQFVQEHADRCADEGGCLVKCDGRGCGIIRQSPDSESSFNRASGRP